MELICSVSLIVKTIGILEDEDDDEDDSKFRDLGLIMPSPAYALKGFD
jgi:hypothetical protein